MIRWKAFIPVSIIVIAVCVIYVFFIDTIVKNIIIKTGQGIFDAKVEINDVEVSLKNSSLKIKGLQIANEDDPWRNLVEVQEITMDIQTLPVLSKKFIIDELSGEGITWGTPRATSGALPRVVKKKKKEEKKKEEADAKKLIDLPLDKLKELGKKVDVKKLIDVENLEAVKQARSIKGDMQEKKKQWEERVAKFDAYKGKMDTIKSDVESVKTIKIKSIADIPEARKKIKKLKDAQKSLKSMKQEISDTKKSILGEIGAVKKSIKQLDSLKSKDYKEIIKNLGFGGISTGRIGNTLFGPLIMSRINTALGWINKIKAKLPKKKDKKAKKPERKRLKGRDIIFPKEKGLPAFLVKKVSFSAEAPEEEGRPRLKLSGKITNVTSNPQLLGKPVKILAQGSFARMKNSEVKITGTMDYTTDVSQEKFIVSIKGYNLKDTSWEGGEYVPSGITKGKGAMELSLSRREKTMSCVIDARATGVRFKLLAEGGGKDNVKKIMNEVFSGIDTVRIKGTIKGVPPKDLDVSLISNLDDVIAKKLKELFGKEIDKQKAQVKKELDNIVNAKKKELLGDLSSKQKELEKKILGSEGSVQERLDMVKNIIQNKESAIRNVGAKKKEEGQKKIQEKLNQQFKKLFK